jgi:FSR family fosmidomycin resistance protein-like MFS transporter
VAGVIAALRNRGLVTLALGHFTVDSYVGVIPVLFPLLIGRFDLDLGTVGLVSLAYGGTASLSQPFFGFLADRFGTRLTGLALVWTASSFAAIGFAPTFPALVVIAAVSGLGSGAFHPFGAVSVRRLLPERRGTTGLSVYVTGGTLGVAFGPLIGVAIFSAFGMRGTLVLLVPGLAIACFLLLAMRARDRSAPPRRPVATSILLVPLAATIFVMASRSWTIITLETFTPTWYHELGYGPVFYGALATTMVLASAVGMIGCGGLADRFGRRTVIVGTLVLSIPAMLLFVLFPGPQGFVWGVLFGLLAASTAPITLILAQELMAARAGLASGLVLGLGFVAGAIGVPVTGAIADHFGLATALGLQVALVVVTIPVALLLPSEKVLRGLRRRASRPGAPALAAAD